MDLSAQKELLITCDWCPCGWLFSRSRHVPACRILSIFAGTILVVIIFTLGETYGQVRLHIMAVGGCLPFLSCLESPAEMGRHWETPILRNARKWVFWSPSKFSFTNLCWLPSRGTSVCVILFTINQYINASAFQFIYECLYLNFEAAMSYNDR